MNGTQERTDEENGSSLDGNLFGGHGPTQVDRAHRRSGANVGSDPRDRSGRIGPPTWTVGM